MYSAQFPSSADHFTLADIHSLKVEEVPRATLATASFPCTDLSLAGMREGLGGKHSSAYWGFVRILKEMGDERPAIVLVENVTGFLTSHDGRDFHSALLALTAMGYKVDALIIDAERFVPQSRVRLFIIGHLPCVHQGLVAEPSALYGESELRPRALSEFICQHPEIAWEIRKMPRLPLRKQALSDLLEQVPEDSEHWWNQHRTDYLLNQMSQKHLDMLIKIRNAPVWTYGTVFRRVRNGISRAELRLDGVAGCLRTPRGGSGRQILIRAGFGHVRTRLLTPRECARLMGADDFRIQTTLNKALFGFGDAVCVPVIEWLARYYLNPLFDEIRDARASLAAF